MSWTEPPRRKIKHKPWQPSGAPKIRKSKPQPGSGGPAGSWGGGGRSNTTAMRNLLRGPSRGSLDERFARANPNRSMGNGLNASLGVGFGALAQTLAGSPFAQGPGGGDDGGGGYGGDGYGGAFDPAPILAQFAALRAALQGQANAANTQIGANADQWKQRLAALQGDQTRFEGQTLQNILSANQQQQANYQAQVAPVTADLQAQGFSAAPVQQTATLDDQHLKDVAERQRQLSQRFGEINQRSYTDRQAAEAGQTAGAKNVVAMKLADYMLQLEQAQAEALGSGGGGGGGGGGGYGGGGGGGYDSYTAGDAGILGAMAEHLPDARDSAAGGVYSSPEAQALATQILYGNKGEKYSIGGKFLKPLGHLNVGGGQGGNPNLAGQVLHKYLAQLKRKGVSLGMKRSKFVDQFISNLASGQKERRKAKNKLINYTTRAAARNIP